MATALTSHVYQHRIGDDATLTIPIRDASGDTLTLTGETEAGSGSGSESLSLSCRAYPGSTTETFDHSSTGVTVAGAATGVTVAFTEAALTSVTPGVYVFTITRTSGTTTTTYPLGSHFILILLPQLQ